jgi:hypothetical protein
MGAASIILYASRDFKIASIIIDSPFAVLRELCRELAASYKLIPSALANYMLEKVRGKVKEMMGFDLYGLNPINHSSQCRAPALFVHAINDELIDISHMRRIYDAYGGDKSKIEIQGGHNTQRPDWFIDFACKHLKSNSNYANFSLLNSMKQREIIKPNIYLKSNVENDSDSDFNVDMDFSEDDDINEFGGIMTARANLPTITNDFK